MGGNFLLFKSTSKEDKRYNTHTPLKTADCSVTKSQPEEKDLCLQNKIKDTCLSVSVRHHSRPTPKEGNTYH